MPEEPTAAGDTAGVPDDTVVEHDTDDTVVHDDTDDTVVHDDTDDTDGPDDTDDTDGPDDTVVYDLSEWEPDQVDTLEWALGREGVPGVLRDRELTVRLEHEGRVDYLIDHLFDDLAGVELTPVGDDGDADINEIETLGELFVAADRLAHDADDLVVRAQFEETATAVGGLPLPYGFEAAVWERIRTMAAWLVDELDGAAPELIEQHARALRDLLRQYV